MSGQFLGALSIYRLFVKNRIRLNEPGERLRRLPVEYHVVYHGERRNQFRARLRRKQPVPRFRHRHEQRSAAARDLREPPRMCRQQRIE